MTKRLEFTRKTKAQRALHAKGICETCHMPVKGRAEYDHYKEAAEGGDNSFENCRYVHPECHKEKTGHYIRERRKHERIRDKNNGSLQPRHHMGSGNNQHSATRPVGKLREFTGVE